MKVKICCEKMREMMESGVMVSDRPDAYPEACMRMEMDYCPYCGAKIEIDPTKYRYKVKINDVFTVELDEPYDADVPRLDDVINEQIIEQINDSGSEYYVLDEEVEEEEDPEVWLYKGKLLDAEDLARTFDEDFDDMVYETYGKDAVDMLRTLFDYDPDAYQLLADDFEQQVRCGESLLGIRKIRRD